MSKIRVNITLPKSLHTKAKQKAKELNITLSSLIEQVLNLYLEIQPIKELKNKPSFSPRRISSFYCIEQ
ncbi:MAG: hypothetical protein ABH896_04105 [Candidatus Jacksonbacteria bacterium]